MSSNEEYSVVITKLSKKFGDFEAVKGIDLKIKKGEIFGILGPNGAGKTTTLNMILGILKPTNGKIIIEGYDNSHDGQKIKQMMGFMTQETVVDSYLTARQNLEIFARLYHIPPDRIEEKVNHALKEANLTSFGDVASGTFSGGMQRRLNLVKSMIQEPKILILDEPTTGLDIQSRVVMWAEIKRLNKLGITIILTTQYLEEADNLCDTIAVIDHGVVKAIGTAAELKKIVAKGNILGITVKDDDMVKVTKILKSKFGLDVMDNNGRLEAPITEKPLQQLIKIAQELQKEGIEVLTISMHLPTMDDVFIKLTGASIRDDTSSGNAQAQKNMIKVGFGGRR
jgi:ABC-2 type transport system ATP-binding protein